MKVQWTLFDLTTVDKNHLKANLEYWKWDLLKEAGNMVKRVEKSHSLNLLSKVKSAGMIINLGKARAELGASDIDAIVKYEITEPRDGDNNVIVLELFVDPGYFSTSDVARNQLGKRASRVLKVFGRQELISSFEQEFAKLYTHEFYGEILEDDDINLHVKTKA